MSNIEPEKTDQSVDVPSDTLPCARPQTWTVYECHTPELAAYLIYKLRIIRKSTRDLNPHWQSA
eukprot:5181859-Amphidinium_carterae.1